jgi:hypothetical protein
MRKLVILSISGLFYAVASCCGCGGNDDAGHGHDSISHDSGHTAIVVDTTSFKDTGGYVNDSLAQMNEIEQLYGEQWDFCDCVVKNDSIEKALMATEDDAQIDLILVRMDEVDQHCKSMLAQPNTTPEQRDRHARKVRKCLKEAGVL